MASTHIKSINQQNASNTYSKFNMVKFNLEDEEDRYMLHHASTAWVTDGSSIAPQSDYAYIRTYQEHPKQDDYFTDADERVYIDIRHSKGFMGEFEHVNCDDSDVNVTVDLKVAAPKNMRLRVTGYFQGKYMYMLSKDGRIMNYKEYGVNKQKSLSQ